MAKTQDEATEGMTSASEKNREITSIIEIRFSNLCYNKFAVRLT